MSINTDLNTYGWATPPSNVMDNYISKCEKFVEDDNLFKNFRQDPDYKIILEGWNEGGYVWLQEIINTYGKDHLVERLDLFKRNDIYGGPTIINYPVVGNMCPFTLKYILDAFRIVDHLGNQNYKKIVEVGAGFGSMCIIMDSIYDFEEYTIVDLPAVVELTKKYLKHFPEIYNKVIFIPCDKMQDDNKQYDLFISDAALAECNLDTQIKYYNSFIKNSNFGYINYNSEGHYIGQKNFNIFKNKLEDLFNIKDIHNIMHYMYITKKI